MLSTIETAARLLGNEINTLCAILDRKDEEQQALEERYELEIEKAKNTCLTSYRQVLEYLKSSPELFVDPKTRIIDAVKVGFVKERDAVSVGDEDEAIADLVLKRLPEKYDQLVRTKRTIVKEVLKSLSIEELALINCHYMPGENNPAVTVVQPELKKALKEILK